jgi:hypothetical protein
VRAFPSPQCGVRLNQRGRSIDTGSRFFNGYNRLPSSWRVRIAAIDQVASSASIAGPRRWRRAAPPPPGFTFKEQSRVLTPNPLAEPYWLSVIQLECQCCAWFFAGGYAGQKLTDQRSPAECAPISGLRVPASASAGTPSSIRAWRRKRASGSTGFRQHWRLTLRATWIYRSAPDSLGQYRHHSDFARILRYRF